MRSRSVNRGAAGLLVALLVMAHSAFGAPPVSAAPSAGDFFPVVPVRLLDTRLGGGPLAPGEARALVVTGRGGVPEAAQVRAVALSVTVTNPTAQTFVTVHPSGVGRPVASNLNAVPGQTVANAVVSGTGADGAVALFNAAGTTDLVVDLLGWFSATPEPGGTKFLPVTPVRLADTRPDRPVFGGEALLFSLSSTPPYDQVRAAALNVTATEPQGHGYFSVLPWDMSLPVTSMLNFVPGQTVASATFTGIGPYRRAGVLNGSPHPVHQVVDLNGVFIDADAAQGGGFTPVGPFRLVDTRLAGGPLGPGEARTVSLAGTAVPADAGAIVANVTVVGPTTFTFVTMWPGGTPRPGVSNVNARPNETVPNLVTSRVEGGEVQLFNAEGTSHVLVDVVGWYSTPTAL